MFAIIVGDQKKVKFDERLMDRLASDGHPRSERRMPPPCSANQTRELRESGAFDKIWKFESTTYLDTCPGNACEPCGARCMEGADIVWEK